MVNSLVLPADPIFTEVQCGLRESAMYLKPIALLTTACLIIPPAFWTLGRSRNYLLECDRRYPAKSSGCYPILQAVIS
ncbi:hypothetical protein HC766_08395 [Candidatus Gracilibacteria bacterium]|nr:hypothetical protein [Candidatus Gracilibacteria bacterium]